MFIPDTHSLSFLHFIFGAAPSWSHDYKRITSFSPLLYLQLYTHCWNAVLIHCFVAPSTAAYSSVLTPASTTQGGKYSPSVNSDATGLHDPFRYSREDMISIWRVGATTHGGPGWKLGIEVERHEGVVIDVETTPSCAREMTEAEIKLYTAPSLNSRRPSLSHGHSHNNPRTERDGENVGLGILGRRGLGNDGSSMALPLGGIRGGAFGAGPTSPMRDRFSRRDSGGTTQPYRPRQLGGTGTTPHTEGSPSVVSPRGGGFGFGGGPGFDGVLGAGEGWGGRKRGALTGGRQASFLKDIQEKPADKDGGGDAGGAAGPNGTGESASAVDPEHKLANGDADPSQDEGELQEEPAFENWEDDPEIATNGISNASGLAGDVNQVPLEQGAIPNSPPNPSEIQWQYVDDQGVTQGPFQPDQLRSWAASNWLRPDLPLNRPDYDTLFLTLTEWRVKLNSLGIMDENHLFHTWYEPVTDVAPPQMPVALPPGLNIHPQQLQQMQQSDMRMMPQPSFMQPLEPEFPRNEAPSVFDALKRPELGSYSPSPIGSGAKGTHTPSSVFGNAGDPVFTHSPISSHRQPMKPGGHDSTHTSSPASSVANVYSGAIGDPTLGGLIGGARLSNMNALHSQVPANYQAAGFARSNGLYGQDISRSNASPLVAYNAHVSPYAAGNDQSVGSMGQSRAFFDPAVHRGSHDPHASPSMGWQAHRTGPISTVPPATNSTTSSLSNAPKANFGDRRSPSPVDASGGLASALGGEIYDGSIGSMQNSAINRLGEPMASYPAQPSYDTIYRTSIPPIPEAVNVPEGILDEPSQEPDEVAQEPAADETEVKEEPPVSEPISNAEPEANVTPPQTKVPEPPKNAWGILPTKQSAKPAPEEAKVLSQGTPSSNKEGPPTNIWAENALKNNKDSRKRESNPEVAPKPADTLSVGSTLAASQETVNEDDNQPFIPVKKRGAGVQSTTEQVTAAAPVASASVTQQPTAPAPPATSKMTVSLASLVTNPSPVTPSAPPKAWATVAVKDDAKGMSLKEIQEAEAKRAKEAQKARSTATPAVSSPVAGTGKEEEPATMTWGLPISMAGGRTPSATKDVTSPVTTAPTAVWANAAKAAANPGAKKPMNMKDIQEEEERRKKKEKDANSAARRVSEKPPPPAVAPAVGGAWATVGPGGKTTRPSTASSTTSGAPTGIASLPPRPSAAAIAGSGMRAPQLTNAAASMGATPAAGSAPRRPAVVVNATSTAPKTPSVPPSAEDPTGTVSAETLKWLRNALKGRLAPGITVDEVVGLVLTMQEVDDIADTFYQCGPTLPGRPLAAEFIDKRNADKANGPPTTASARTPSSSTAEASRSQAAASQDASGYKVVKKKGKGGKA
ncbi:hypothetical protein CPB86DRAFT_47034 [Serendipita vermifera]|nr:hypothetical protein CPB86DRAFT_47034 [Serendipita vermifera]